VGVLSTPGAGVTLAWFVENATTITVTPDGPTNSATTTGSAVVSPATTTTYTLSASNAAGTASRTVTVHIGVTPAPPRLNEFLADNEEGITDVDGAHSDWIEIHNPNSYAVDLQGYALTNGPTQVNASRWDFPAGSAIPANGYRVVFASQKNLTNPANALHTDFSLEKAGEYLALVRLSDNAILTEFAPYPGQYADSSYGYGNSPLRLGYFGVPTGSPTPGTVNNTGVLGFLDKTDDTQFTITRGFYTSAITTVLNASSAGLKLIYTTDGSAPTETNGTQVLPSGPDNLASVSLTIHPGSVPVGQPGVNIASIGGVTTLRAAAFLAGYAPTNVDTQTYLFPAQVLTQTAANAVSKGWPSAPVNGQTFNFGMDPNVVSSFTPAEMNESLQSIPTLSVVTDMKNLVDPTIGIYVNADQHGDAWERPISVELIHPPGYVSPDGNPTGFQIDGGLRIRGGFSRNDQFFKHGFRLFFSGKYDGRLKYPLFGTEGTDEFGKLDLGTGSNYAWYREGNYSLGQFNTMVRDPFARDTQGALGQPYTKSRYYHLYLNGHYWGLYYTEERAEAEFAASYFGGDDSEYDAVKCANHIGNFITEATDGTLTNWHALWTRTRAIRTTDPSAAKFFELEGRNPDGTRNPALPVPLDVNNLIDEMLVNFYVGDGDAILSGFHGHDRPNNWFSVFRKDGRDGFRFFIRDAEHSLGTTSWVPDQTGPWTGANVYNITYANPQSMHQDLMASAEYRLRFADRVRKHFFDNGALTAAQCIARFQKRARQVEKGMKAESARWGDAQSITNLPAGHPPRYIVADWQAAISTVTNSIMPNRSGTVLAQITADGLFPNVPAPAFADAGGAPHYGGPVPVGFQLRIAASQGTIYYTVNGGDPRLPGGAVATNALTGSSPASLTLNSTATVRARVFNASTSIWSALTEAEYLVGALGDATNLVISKVHYNPAGDSDLQEFIEVMNISAINVDLTNCAFTAGIDFTFPDGYTLAAGARCLVVRDLAAFQAAYPSVPLAQIAGVFESTTVLKNEGETVQLIGANDAVIKEFAYGNGGSWPATANGSGACLVLLNAAANPDHAVPSSWRASGSGGGTPGVSDAMSYSAWATNAVINDPAGTGDEDRDGLSSVFEYALGSDPRQMTLQPGTTAIQTLTVNSAPAEYLTLTYTRPIGRDEATIQVQASSNLTAAWIDAVQVGQATLNVNDTETYVFRHPLPKASDSNQFLRLKVTRVP
jgi:hypothetical protein